MDRRRFVAAVLGVAAGACAGDDGRAATAPSAGTVPVRTASPGTAGATSATHPPGTTSTPAPTTATVHDGSPAAFVQRASTGRPEVALTFHTNGDVALADELLDRLAARRVPVTAFVVGSWLAEQPALGHRLLAEGHELANHTWSHLTMGGLDVATIRDEIDGCAAVIRGHLGGPGRWFRPSGMEVASEDVLVEAGRAGYPTVVGYSVDSLDFTDPGAEAVSRNVVDVVGAGDVVSLHFGHADTVAAIDGIVDHLEAVGLRPVTLATLLA